MPFMVPKTSNQPFIRYEWNNEENYVPANVEGTLPDDAKVLERYQGKWFARLSAPGYLDATDWYGPQDGEDTALYDLWFIHGNDDTFYEFVEEQKKILVCSLRITGIRNELYGATVEDRQEVHIATMGDILPDDYDPNEDPDLEEAFDFEIVNAIQALALQDRFKKAESAWRGA